MLSQKGSLHFLGITAKVSTVHNLNGRVLCAHGVMALDAVTMLIWIEGEVFFHMTVPERRETDVAADGAGPRLSV